MTTTALARRFRIDVSTDNATWTQVKGIDDYSPTFSPTKNDSTSYDQAGWMSYEITMYAWSAVLKVLGRATGGTLDPGIALIKNCVGNFGQTARLYVRWYDTSGISPGTTNIVESGTGLAIVEIAKSKSGVGDLEEWTVTFTGDGAATALANPYLAAAVPVITGATPTGIGVGGLVTITGTNFTGTVVTTGVKFAAVNATGWVVVNDSTIVATMPAGSAGSAPITVTNAAGASATFPYTRT